MFKNVLFVLGVTFFSNVALSQVGDKEVFFEEKISGVTYEFDSEGSILKIRSVGEADLTIGDRKDVRVSLKKATLRAKSNIAKFLNEDIHTEEVLESISEQVSHATKESSTITRNEVEKNIEVIKSNSQAILKGVVVLSQDINKDEGYVKVEVGYSTNSQKAADKMKNDLTDNLDGNSAVPEANKESKGRKVIKSSNYDNF